MPIANTGLEHIFPHVLPIIIPKEPSWVEYISAFGVCASAIISLSLAYITHKTLQELKIQRDLNSLPDIIMLDSYFNTSFKCELKHETKYNKLVIIYRRIVNNLNIMQEENYKGSLNKYNCIVIANCGRGTAKKITIRYLFDIEKSITNIKKIISQNNYCGIGFTKEENTISLVSIIDSEEVREEVLCNTKCYIQYLNKDSESMIKFPAWYFYIATLYTLAKFKNHEIPELNVEIEYSDPFNNVKKIDYKLKVDDDDKNFVQHPYQKLRIMAIASSPPSKSGA